MVATRFKMVGMYMGMIIEDFLGSSGGKKCILLRKGIEKKRHKSRDYLNHGELVMHFSLKRITCNSRSLGVLFLVFYCLLYPFYWFFIS